MPLRDEQDYENKRQRIIDAALHVFASKGFEKATNKDIARAARIKSPGLIYHYFQDKADLFREVVQQRAPVLQLLDHSEDMVDMPPREALTLFATTFLKVVENRTAMPMFKLMLSEAARHSVVAEVFNKLGPNRAFAFLTRYLERQMDAGVLRRMDTGAAVRCFIGPLIAYVITREVFVQADSKTLAPDTMVATHVDIFLRGMQK